MSHRGYGAGVGRGVGRGRGRDLTLPAWMTDPGAAAAGPAPNATYKAPEKKVRYVAKGTNTLPLGKRRTFPVANDSNKNNNNAMPSYSQPQQRPQHGGGTQNPYSYNANHGNARGPMSVGAAPTAAEVWTEYKTPEGRPYYHNRVTNQTVWEKPAAMQPHVPAPLPVPVQPAAVPLSPWKEYSDAQGRKYYHNHATGQTTWECPPELCAAATPAVKTPTPVSQVAAIVAQTPLAQQQQQQPQPQPQPQPQQSVSSAAAVATSSATVAAAGTLPPSDGTPAGEFRRMLAECGCRSDWTWEQTMRATINDPRYRVLPTLAAKQAAFQAYVSQSQKSEMEARWAEEKEQRHTFRRMLEEPSSGIRPDMTWEEARTLVEAHPSYAALKDERARETEFMQYANSLNASRRDEEASRQRTLQAALLEEFRTDSSIGTSSAWREVRTRYLDGSPTFQELSDVARLSVFEDHMRDLERQEKERKRAEEQLARDFARDARAQFRRLLDEHEAAGDVTVSSTWRSFVPLIVDEPAYKLMESVTSGSSARMLFYDRVDELVEKYEKQRPLLKSRFAESGLTVTVNTTYDEFATAMIGQDEVGKSLEPAHLETYLRECKKRVVREAEEAERRVERYRRRLLRAMHAHADLSEKSSFEDAAEVLSNEREWSDVADESSRREVFAKFVEEAAQGGPTDPGSPESSSKRKRSSSSTRSSSSRSSRRSSRRGSEERSEKRGRSESQSR